MSNEWKDLPDLQLVATAQAEGWEIMKRLSDECVWVPWYGEVWSKACQYRGRPKQPKTKQVEILGWLTSSGQLVHWHNGAINAPNDWKRVPAEDKTVEVEE